MSHPSRPTAGAVSRRGFLGLLGAAAATVLGLDGPSRAQAAVAERWADLYLPAGEGPFRALVSTDPAGDLVLRFTRAAVEEMTKQLDPRFDIYGGVAWAPGSADIALIYLDADDTDPIEVVPDARGLYELPVGDAFEEEPPGRAAGPAGPGTGC
jgi:hypothetical protein